MAGGGLKSKLSISSTRSKQSAERYFFNAKRGGGGEGAGELPPRVGDDVGASELSLSNSADKRQADLGLGRGRRASFDALGVAGEASRRVGAGAAGGELLSGSRETPDRGRGMGDRSTVGAGGGRGGAGRVTTSTPEAGLAGVD